MLLINTKENSKIIVNSNVFTNMKNYDVAYT